MKFKELLKEPIFNISNLLSIMRVLLIVPFFFLSELYQTSTDIRHLLLLLGVVLAAVITDFLDGFLARLLQQETVLGKYLDPICDKIATIAALFFLMADYYFPVWVFIFYLLREILGIWLGSFLFFKRNIQGMANMWGKTGVAVISVSAVWYLSIPWLSTFLKKDHILLFPEVSAYILVFILTGGIITYSVTYWNVVFSKSK